MHSIHLPTHLIQSRLRGLYVLTDGADAARHVQMAEAAVRGGAAVIQLRAKDLLLRDALEAAQQIRRLTIAANVLFIVNDRIDLAMAAEADGVHLGDDDLPPQLARRIMGRNAVIGVSTSSVQLAQTAAREGASYLGVGAVFGTVSKADAGPAIGLQQLRKVSQSSSLPVAAIGGINQHNIHQVPQHGADMACVISAVSGAASSLGMTDRVRELVTIYQDNATF